MTEAYSEADPREDVGGIDERDAAQEVQEHAEQPRRDPLPPEEVERRWRDTQRGLKEERSRRRDIERELAELRGRVSAQPQGQAKAQPDMPDPDQDPMGAIQFLMRKVGEYEGQTAQQRQQQERQTAEQREFQALGERIVEAEADFKLTHPDLDEAVKHYKEARAHEMVLQGIPAGQVQQELTMEIINTSKRALAADKNPAEIFYNLAKRRGYGVDRPGEVLQPNSEARTAPRSLSSVGSRSGTGTLTIEGVNKLTGKDFDRAKAKLVGRA